jgi:Mn-dependent DtxR family transcriptional regulator
MQDQVESILFCWDCITKHASDLLHHAEVSGDEKAKEVARKALEIRDYGLKMIGVSDVERYKLIRDLEHHLEDLLLGLRELRKALSRECPSCVLIVEHEKR